jgi:hypothetical protein
MRQLNKVKTLFKSPLLNLPVDETNQYHPEESADRDSNAREKVSLTRLRSTETLRKRHACQDILNLEDVSIHATFSTFLSNPIIVSFE